MKKIMTLKIILVAFVLALIIAGLPLFLEIVPCTSWYGSNTGMIDFGPHRGFCSLFDGSSGLPSPNTEYFNMTTSPTLVLMLIFILSFLIVYIILFVVRLLIRKKDIQAR